MDVVKYLADQLTALSAKVDAIDKRLDTHLAKFAVYTTLVALVVASAVSWFMGK